MKRTLILCFALLALVPQLASAQVPKTISYQGVLRDGGMALVPDGVYEMTFRLYDLEIGGTPLWTEIDSVDVLRGVFNVVLGKKTALDLPFEEAYWLSVEVEGGGELDPRVELTASPYAFHAAMADSLIGGPLSDGDWTISGNDVYSAVTGNVGVGTSTPDWKLTIHDPGATNLSLSTGGGAYAALRLQSFVPGEWFTIDGNWGGLRLSSPQDIFMFPGVGRRVDIRDGDLVVVDGSLGVGIQTPAEKLHVEGTARVSGFMMATGAADGYVLTSDASGVGTWGPPGGGGLPGGSSGQTLRHDGANWVASSMLYNSGTRVGIGTTSPNQSLDVNGKIEIGDDANPVSAGAIRWTGTSFEGYDGSTWKALDVQSTSGGGWTDVGTQVRLTTISDLVGIGTTNPTYQLDIQRTGIGASGARARVKGYANSNRPSSYMVVGKSRGSQATPATTLPNDTLGVVEGHGINAGLSDGLAARMVFVQPDGVAGNYVPGLISFETCDGNTAVTERMRIDAFGDVTISGDLDMSGNFVTNVAYPTSDSDAATREYVDDEIADGDYDWTVTMGDDMYSSVSGFVGVGTPTPGARLDVNGDVIVRDTLDMSSKRIVNVANPVNPQDAVTKSYADSVSGTALGGSGTAKYIPKFTASATLGNSVIYESDPGNVGIGTMPAGSNRLDVEGAMGVGAGYAGTNTAPTNGMIVEGKVGLGTSTVKNQLDVEGAAAVGASYSGTSTAPANGLVVEGSVGIGTSAPNNKLDVEGGMVVGAGYAGSTTGPANGLLVEGNVGIGTSSVNYNFEVNGTAGFSENIYHVGDNDTYVRLTTDRIDLYAGGRQMLTAYESSQDVLTINGGGGNVDFRVEADTTVNALFVNGGNSRVGIGTSLPQAKLHVVGDAYAESLTVVGTTVTGILEITGGSDLAEPFDMSEGAQLSPGTVVVIDDQHPGKLKKSSRAYDRCVAGVVSGAGGVRPGLMLRQDGSFSGGQNVALTGRVWCLADASYGAIEPGDRLTTSDTPGHAMKVTDNQRAVGSVIGKAMSGLSEGQGLVLLLVQAQ